MEGTYELHYERDPWGALTWRLYGRCESGQLRFVTAWEQGPFDGASEGAVALTRALIHDQVVPAR